MYGPGGDDCGDNINIVGDSTRDTDDNDCGNGEGNDSRSFGINSHSTSDSLSNDGNGNIAYDPGGDIHNNNHGRRHAYDPDINHSITTSALTPRTSPSATTPSFSSNCKFVYDPSDDGPNSSTKADTARDDDESPGSKYQRQERRSQPHLRSRWRLPCQQQARAKRGHLHSAR
jgi:hypothetical protein